MGCCRVALEIHLMRMLEEALKKFRFACVSVFLTMVSSFAPSAFAANPDACENLRDNNHKFFCRSLHMKDRIQCDNISDSGWKELCLQHSKKLEPYACESVQDEKLLYYCYALTYRSQVGCFNIENDDLEFLCYSHLQNKQRLCDDVRDENMRGLCFSLKDSLAPVPVTRL